MKGHSAAIEATLAALTGQWVEAVDPAPHPVLVTSRAAVLHGDLRGPSGAPTRDDARVLCDGHPFLEDAPADFSVDVFELMPM